MLRNNVKCYDIICEMLLHNVKCKSYYYNFTNDVENFSINYFKTM